MKIEKEDTLNIKAASKKHYDENIAALMEAVGFDKETSEELLHIFSEQALNQITDIKEHIK